MSSAEGFYLYIQCVLVVKKRVFVVTKLSKNQPHVVICLLLYVCSSAVGLYLYVECLLVMKKRLFIVAKLVENCPHVVISCRHAHTVCCKAELNAVPNLEILRWSLPE